MDGTNGFLWDLADAVRRAAWEGLPENRRPPRTFVAAGPDFAHDCWQLVTHVQPTEWGKVTQASPGVDTEMTGYSRGIQVVTVTVTLVSDCMPAAEVLAGTVVLPSVDDLTAWTRQMLGDVWTSYLATRLAAKNAAMLVNDVGAPLVDDEGCDGIDVAGIQFSGPDGLTAAASWAVRINLSTTTSRA